MRQIPEVGLQLLDRYRLDELLSANSETAVYRCQDMRLSVTGALKFLLEDDEDRANGDRRNAFLTSMRNLARLNHPNIIHLTNIETKKGLVFSVMEWLCGMTLRQHLIDMNETLTIPEILEIFISTADAVATAHTSEIFHKQLNPTNIFLNVLGSRLAPKLLNFSTTKDIEMLNPVCDLPFVAPEQLADFNQVTAQSDIFSLSATLFFALARTPHIVFDSLDAYREYYASAPSVDIPDSIPEFFRPILSRGLAPKPEDRFESAMDYLSELRKVASNFQLSANLTLDAPKSYKSCVLMAIGSNTPLTGIKTSTSQVSPLAPDAPIPAFRPTLTNVSVRVQSALTDGLDQIYGIIQPIFQSSDRSVLLVKKYQDDPNNTYVLKVLHQPSLIQRTLFLQSAHTAQKLSELTPLVPTIVAIHEEAPAILMPACGQRSLASVIESNGPLSPLYALEVGIYLAQALCIIHENHFLHGNIKLTNVFFEERQGATVPILYDIGQRLYVDKPQELTFSQLSFIAPETGFNLQLANVQSDIYAFGMLLNTMILGHFPFQGKNAPMIYQNILAHKDAPSLRELAPNIHPDLVRIIDWCTAFNPLARYQSMSDVLRDLYIILPKLRDTTEPQDPDQTQPPVF